MKIQSLLVVRALAGICFLVASSAFLLSIEAASKKKHSNLGLCSRPSQNCDSREKKFAPYELGFRLPAPLKANEIYESAPFYAVILQRDLEPSCDGGEFTRKTETFRLQTQKHFTNRKVFADHQCPDMGAVFYSEVRKAGRRVPTLTGAFVAVYAGKTEAEAQRVFKEAKRQFPRALLRRLRVGYSRVVQ